MSSVFASTASAWSARPGDSHDVFLAQLVDPKPGRHGIGLFGVPYDGAVLGRTGAREGPDAIRAQLAKLKIGDFHKPVFDFGNVRVPHGSVDAAHQATESGALEVLAAGCIPVTLGGDHSLTFPLVKAHEGRRQKLGVINLDAHLDIRDFTGAPNSGTSFGRLIELGLVPGEKLVEVGLRPFANAAAYEEKARKAGITMIDADAWLDDPHATIQRAIDVASRGTEGIYLSVDMDVLDQAHAPGVSAPTPGGIDSATLLRAIRQIAASGKLVGADFMEVAPPLDREGMTSRAAAYAVATLITELR